MSDLSANLPQIISAAAQSQLGILALLSVALSVLAYFFFSAASEKVKVGIFAMLFAGVIGFGVAMFRTPATAQPPAPATPGTEEREVKGPEVTQAPQAPKALVADDALIGHWSGQARDAEGTVFQVDVRINQACVPGRPCGSIRVSHVPCQGELTLEQVNNGDHEFSVDHFSGDSAPACSKGAGEHFRRQADGTLLYTTSYDPKARATLVKK